MNTLIHTMDDCLAFSKNLSDNSIKLVISSPPYNIGKEYESKKSLEIYAEEQKQVIQEMHRICADDGSICWQVGNYVNKSSIIPLDYLFFPIFFDLGMKLRNRIIWRFGHGLHASKRLSGRYEILLWFTKSDDYVFNLDPIRVPSKYPGKRHFKGKNKGRLSGNPKGKNPSDVWEIISQEWEDGMWENIPNVKQNHCEKTKHPCQFPVELVERCVLALTNEGDWVYDPYSGVGSSIIAAIKNNRKAAGTEIDQSYFNIAEARIAKFFNGSLKTRSVGTKIHVPKGKLTEIPEEWK